jgi:hypothetical protein
MNHNKKKDFGSLGEVNDVGNISRRQISNEKKVLSHKKFMIYVGE